MREGGGKEERKGGREDASKRGEVEDSSELKPKTFFARRYDRVGSKMMTRFTTARGKI